MNLVVKGHASTVSNGVYSIADYISLPIAMLCAAPLLIRHLGMDQYAVWILASAAVSGGMLMSSWFGDAAVKHISACRGREDHAGAERVLRTMLGINLGLGLTVASLLYAATPLLVAHLPNVNTVLRANYQKSLAIGCALLVVKAVESVFISTQKAFERYGVASQLNILIRATTIVVAVVVAERSGSVVMIMWATLFVSLLGLALQGYGVWRDMRPKRLLPQWHHETAHELFGFGCYSWLQALVGMLTQHADRLIVGYMLGTQALTYYSICVQAAQPIHGVVSSGLHTLFPHLGARIHTVRATEMRRKIVSALAVNVALVVTLTAPMMIWSRYLLREWMGAEFSEHASATLTIIALGFALMGLNVTGYYILMALGRIRPLVIVNSTGAAAMLILIALLTPKYGIVGAAIGRLVYGPITWITYRSIGAAVHSAERPVQEFTIMPEAYENG